MKNCSVQAKCPSLYTDRHKTHTLTLPFEQMYMQALNHNNELIPEQQPNESNPLFELIQNKHITSWPT